MDAWWISRWEKVGGMMAACSPQSCCGDTYLCALGGLGGCWLQQRLIFLLSKWSPCFCSSPWSVLCAPKWLLMPSAKNVLYKPGRLGTHCLAWACLVVSSSLCKQFLGSLIFPPNILMWRFCSSGCFHSLQRRIVMGQAILPHWWWFLQPHCI